LLALRYFYAEDAEMQLANKPAGETALAVSNNIVSGAGCSMAASSFVHPTVGITGTAAWVADSNTSADGGFTTIINGVGSTFLGVASGAKAAATGAGSGSHICTATGANTAAAATSAAVASSELGITGTAVYVHGAITSAATGNVFIDPDDPGAGGRLTGNLEWESGVPVTWDGSITMSWDATVIPASPIQGTDILTKPVDVQIVGRPRKRE